MTSEHEILRDAARQFLHAHCSTSFLRDAYHSPEQAHVSLWPKMAEMGWLGLGLDEAFGGTAADISTLSILVEEMGRVCLPGPYFSSVVVCGQTVSRWADQSQKRQLLSRLVSGESVPSLAIQEGASEFDLGAMETCAVRVPDGYVLSGRKRMVPYARLADVLLCVARINTARRSAHDSVGIFIVPHRHAKVQCTPLLEISGACVDDIELVDVELPETALLGGRMISSAELRGLLAEIAVIKSVEMLGGAQRAMEIATDYAKERRQFGKVIGSFQAVQHHCSNMLVQVETARRMTYETIAMLDEGRSSLGRAAMTKVWANCAYREVVRLGHQVLGGIGYIDEHAMPWHFRHARHCEGVLGDNDTLLELVAEGLYRSCENTRPDARDDARRSHCNTGRGEHNNHA